MTSFAGDRVEVALVGDAASPVAPSPTPEREFRATAACGVCGKASIDDLDQALPPITPIECRPALFEALPDRPPGGADALRGRPEASTPPGSSRWTASRSACARTSAAHNAVDKAIGHFVLRDGCRSATGSWSSAARAGFELVQKALMAAIPAMVSVGAASSVAVDMATAAGMTLYSFAGRGRGNLHVT